MKKMSLTRRTQNREYELVAGLFFSAFGCWNLMETVSSGQVNNCIGGLWLPVGLSLLVRCWKASAGLHELHWEANHAKIVSDGKVEFDGSLQKFKTIVGDQLGYDLHFGGAFVYRLKSVNIDDDLRALLDAACAV